MGMCDGHNRGLRAVLLMLAGIGLVGAVTAAVATWMLGRVAEERAGTAKIDDQYS